jgi:hypothetical protein
MNEGEMESRSESECKNQIEVARISILSVHDEDIFRDPAI